MDVGARRPIEPKEANWNTRGADEGWGKALLWFEFTIVVVLGFRVAVKVPEEGWSML